MSRLSLTFKNSKNPVFISYLTAGFPTGTTVNSMLSLQQNGTDVIEIGVPFSDPIADGKVIQKSSFLALRDGITLKKCLEFVKEARQKGLVIPVVLMGYYNPFLNYGRDLFKDCCDAGIDGFIVVDLPADEAVLFRSNAVDFGLSYIPLITPTTSKDRIQKLVSIADSFIYVVSVSGVTGGRATVSTALPDLVSRIKQFTDIPLAVGFGVQSREQFLEVGRVAEGVVIGSRIVMEMERVYESGGDVAEGIGKFAREITGVTEPRDFEFLKAAKIEKPSATNTINFNIAKPSLQSLFGDFGGQYAPEALVDCLSELESAFKTAITDESFWEEFKSYYSYMGRESPLHSADRLSPPGGARIYLKREDLNHTGSHKINNALGQAILAKRLGKSRIIAETGAGQHGVATATVCAKLGLECIIYMGLEDIRRQALNVFRIKLLGAKVVPVDSGSKTLKDAINEAMRDWVTNVSSTHYIIGSAIGPYPFPVMVREFQSVIGRESRKQMLDLGGLPDVVVACVGGGSNAIGMFHPFADDISVRLVGVEAGGDGISTGKHSATLTMGRPGVLHGTRTYLMQDENGQIIETHSISAGLDYPGVGPEHAHMKDSGRAEYVVCDDDDAMRGFRMLSQQEGIIPALETAHAVFAAVEIAKTLGPDKKVLICVSGRGDKDVATVAEVLPKIGPKIGWDLRFEGS